MRVLFKQRMDRDRLTTRETMLAALLKEGDLVRFRWLDTRRKKGTQLRKTLLYGRILSRLSPTDFLVEVVRGGKKCLLHVTVEDVVGEWRRRERSQQL